MIYCQCVTLSTWVLAWLKDPELWLIVGQTNTSYCRRFISFGAEVIIGKQEDCKKICSPEKLRSLQTNEFFENPRPAEVGRDPQACPVQAPLLAGPAGARYFGPWPAATTRHPDWGWGNKPCQVEDSREAVPAHSSCCRWRQPLPEPFPPCAGSKAGAWGWMKESCRCMWREAGCCCCPALLPLLGAQPLPLLPLLTHMSVQ